jgi:hypothetical protein
MQVFALPSLARSHPYARRRQDGSELALVGLSRRDNGIAEASSPEAAYASGTIKVA